MKKKIYLIISIISYIFGVGICGIFVLFSLFGSLLCGKPFYIINGADGPIPICTSIFITDFVWVLIIGIVLLLIGTIFMILKTKTK